MINLPEYRSGWPEAVAATLEIRAIDLLASHFENTDSGPLPARIAPAMMPEIVIDAEWSVSEGADSFGCIFSFGVSFKSEPEPYRFVARFRLLYEVLRTLPPEDYLPQFVWWDAFYTAWPEWREHLSSTLTRGGFSRLTLPLLAPAPAMVNGTDD
jgi:hypothetical protein